MYEIIKRLSRVSEFNYFEIENKTYLGIQGLSVSLICSPASNQTAFRFGPGTAKHVYVLWYSDCEHNNENKPIKLFTLVLFNNCYMF
jgi:hypothetical protein